MKERITYFDTIRWIAAMFIFTTHFIAAFERDIFILWDEVFPINLFMYGVTGKLAVTVLGVVLGYLAFQKGKKDAGNGNTIRYYPTFSMNTLPNNSHKVNHNLLKYLKKILYYFKI